MNLKRIPKKFYDDHCERDLCAPEVVKQTKSHYYIDADNPLTSELIDDAKFYVNEWINGGMANYRGLCMSANATLEALGEQA